MQAPETSANEIQSSIEKNKVWKTKLQITAVKPNYMKDRPCAHNEGIWYTVKSLYTVKSCGGCIAPLILTTAIDGGRWSALLPICCTLVKDCVLYRRLIGVLDLGWTL